MRAGILSNNVSPGVKRVGNGGEGGRLKKVSPRWDDLFRMKEIDAIRVTGEGIQTNRCHNRPVRAT